MHPSDDDAINTTEKVFDLTYNINVKGAFLSSFRCHISLTEATRTGVWYGCKHAIMAMKKNPSDESKGLTAGGSITNTASFVGIMGAATPQLACES